MQLISIQNERLDVIISALGAELQSIKDKDGCEYLWQGDPAYWDRRAINIFPYIARLTEGKYVYEGNEYHLPIHGFLPDAILTVESKSGSEVCFLLKDSEETRSVYPFAFELRIVYALLSNIINIRFEVLNTGDGGMYFGIGGHPGFLVPLETGLEFTDYELEFDRPCTPTRICFSEKCFVTGVVDYHLVNGRTLPLSHDLFDNDAIVLKHMSSAVTLKSGKGEKSVTVSFPDMSYIGFWHAVKKEAPYVCIEPWSSLPSREGIVEDISRQADLIHLPAGKRYVNNWSIKIN